MRVDLALIGFGHVGRRFARLLDEQRPTLRDRYDVECRIVGISTRNHGAIVSLDDEINAIEAAGLVESGGSLSQLRGFAGPDLSLNIPEDPGLLNPRDPRNLRPVDPGDPRPVDPAASASCIERLASSSAPLKVVIETTTLNIRDGRPAIDHVEAALSAGCHVVTANKGPVAFDYRRLASLADKSGVAFLFEGAVMDGVPVFNLVRETLPVITILGFRGVVNSTTNHILTALEDGEEFAPALARMQAAGIAEADPSLDIDGWDAAAKAAALANVLLDAAVTPHDVDRTGLTPDSSARARAALARGLRLRLVASSRRGERPIVRPLELPQDDLLAGLRGMANALVFETDLLGRVAITQLDGNLTLTAYALLSDLLTVTRRHREPTGGRSDRNP
jgi:homoserine dehydrogenase